jgi:hypothetical protein
MLLKEKGVNGSVTRSESSGAFGVWRQNQHRRQPARAVAFRAPLTVSLKPGEPGPGFGGAWRSEAGTLQGNALSGTDGLNPLRDRLPQIGYRQEHASG